jgi:hypothetical protein
MTRIQRPAANPSPMGRNTKLIELPTNKKSRSRNRSRPIVPRRSSFLLKTPSQSLKMKNRLSSKLKKSIHFPMTRKLSNGRILMSPIALALEVLEKFSSENSSRTKRKASKKNTQLNAS